MRFLILNTDYVEFLRWLYTQHPGLETQPYDEQMRVRNESLFGVANFYSANLSRLGHDSWDIHFNNEWMQRAWAQEHGLRPPSPYQWQFRLRRGLVPWFSRVRHNQWLYDILAEQIRHFRPDVVFNHEMVSISSQFLQEMRPHIPFLVGQHAATPLPDSIDFSCYDLVLSSFPPTIVYFQKRGLRAAFQRLAFDPSVLPRLHGRTARFQITFVGSLLPIHSSRMALLEACSIEFPQLRVWGPGVNRMPRGSPIRKRYMGQAWGHEMYQILSRSNITLNHHGDIAPYANNMRLYEATGVSTLLITDWKHDLAEIFEPGKEVITYRTPAECAQLIRHYLDHDDEREAISRAGQERTLRDHTYYHRMQELVEIIERYLRQPEIGMRKVFA